MTYLSNNRKHHTYKCSPAQYQVHDRTWVRCWFMLYLKSKPLSQLIALVKHCWKYVTQTSKRRVTTSSSWYQQHNDQLCKWMESTVPLEQESVANNDIKMEAWGDWISVSSHLHLTSWLDQAVHKQWLLFIEDDDDFWMKKKVIFFLLMIFCFFFKIDFRFYGCDFPLRSGWRLTMSACLAASCQCLWNPSASTFNIKNWWLWLQRRKIMKVKSFSLWLVICISDCY